MHRLLPPDRMRTARHMRSPRQRRVPNEHCRELPRGGQRLKPPTRVVVDGEPQTVVTAASHQRVMNSLAGIMPEFDVYPTGTNADHFDVQLIGGLQEDDPAASSSDLQQAAARVLAVGGSLKPKPAYAGETAESPQEDR